MNFLLLSRQKRKMIIWVHGNLVFNSFLEIQDHDELVYALDNVFFVFLPKAYFDIMKQFCCFPCIFCCIHSFLIYCFEKLPEIT